MNKRIKTILFSVVLMCSIFVSAVQVFAAPGDSGVSASVTEARPGDTFTVTLTVPAQTKQIADLSLKVNFNKTVFEVTEYTIPDIAGMSKMQSTPAEANNAGAFSATYNSLTSDADITFNGLNLTATLKVKDGAAAGPYEFAVANDVGVGSLTEYGTPDILMTHDDFVIKSVTVNVIAAAKPATGISLNKTTTTIITGNSETLTATVTPADSTDTVEWSSDTTSVATVDSTGKVTAVAPGTATITAKAGSKTATCVVTVENAACSHNFTKADKTAEGALKSAGDCKHKALYYYSCTLCGEVEKNDSHTFEGDFGSHNFTKADKTAEGALKSAGDCTHKATYYYSCTLCGEVEKNDSHTFEGDYGSHDFTKTDKTADALKSAGDCKHKATYYYSCTLCGEVEENDSHTFEGEYGDHDFTKTDKTAEGALKSAGDCKHKATYYYSCTLCGEVEKNDSHTFEGDIGSHDFTKTDKTAEGALKSAGDCKHKALYYYSCTTCGEVEKNDSHTFEGDFGSHDFTKADKTAEGALKSAGDCKHKATYYYSCTLCGEVEKNDSHTFEGDYGDHDFDTSAWGYKAADGHAHNCKITGCTAHDTVLPHKPDHEGHATEEYAIKCSDCGYIIEAQLKHNHVFDQSVVDSKYLASSATCTEKAKYYKSCACGEKGNKDTFEDGEPLNHVPSNEWYRNETHHWHICINEGCGIELNKDVHDFVTVGDHEECDDCGYVKESEAKPEPEDPIVGYEGHMTLWIALLLIACLGFVPTVVYSRKRKTNG